MKVSAIVNIIETYGKMKKQLQKDILAYQDYKVFDNDDKRANLMKAKIDRDKQILEAEFKLEALPESYFIEYFENEFLSKLKEIRNELYLKCNELADTLPVAEFQDELKQII